MESERKRGEKQKERTSVELKKKSKFAAIYIRGKRLTSGACFLKGRN